MEVVVASVTIIKSAHIYKNTEAQGFKEIKEWMHLSQWPILTNVTQFPLIGYQECAEHNQVVRIDQHGPNYEQVNLWTDATSFLLPYLNISHNPS